MEEALSASSSLITLAGFAFKASKSLYQTVESFESVKRTIRELRSDLESLTRVLHNLREVADQNEAELAALKLPLLRCGKICNRLEETINNCTTHSDGETKSFRDQTKLQYRGGDITDLRATLASYKATIGITLDSATFRPAAVTTGELEKYKRIIEEARSDLREQLANINERLRSLLQRGASRDRDTADLKDTREEKESAEQCLRICMQVSDFIKHSQESLSQDRHDGGNISAKRDTVPCNAEIDTKATLVDFRSWLPENSTTLKARLAELDEKLRASAGRTSEDTCGANIGLDNMREERDSIAKWLDTCTDASSLPEEARTNIFEDVASGDYSHQLVVSTIDDLISAKRIVTGSRSVQWLGHMSNDTIQKLSNSHRQRAEENESEKQKQTQDDFWDRYGTGHNLHFGKSERMASPFKSNR